ncbi:M20 family metallopeptidase [Phyllobacterium sp. SB3]|uniref:M20 family metallopeptidase n=1 Tax=Phyllobacterium sp. SB3 TaxID=3156073 RepID=UPI0032AFDA41
MTDGRLSHVELLARDGETGMPCRRLEGFQKIERRHPGGFQRGSTYRHWLCEFGVRLIRQNNAPPFYISNTNATHGNCNLIMEKLRISFHRRFTRREFTMSHSSNAVFPIDALLWGIRRWVEIESPSQDGQAVNRMTDIVEADYRAQGVQTQRIPGRDGLGDHLIARKGNKHGPGILVLSHNDTVHPVGTLDDVLPFRIEGDRAFGPGIADMKGGAFLAFSAIAQLDVGDLNWTLPVTHVLVSDEEIGSPTSRELIEAEARKAKYVLVTEPGRNGGRCVTARKGIATFELKVHGRATHAGLRHRDGRNAIIELAKHILAIEALTDYERGLTINVGTIRGGTKPNVVPFEAIAEIDIRLPTPPMGEEIIRKLREIRPTSDDYKLMLTGRIKRPPYTKTEAISELYETARSIASDLGFDLSDSATSGASDANFTASIAATLDGIGVNGLDSAHTHYECMEISSAPQRAQMLYQLLRTLR